MAGNNAIGTGALILTSNAAELASQLDYAQQRAERFANNTNKALAKAGDIGKGGAWGGMLGALAGGAGDLFSKALAPGSGSGIDRLTTKISGMGSALSGMGSKLATIGAEAGGMGGAVAAGVGAGLTALGKMSDAAAGITDWMRRVGSLSEQLRPFAQTDEEARGLDAISFAVGRIDQAIDRITIKFLNAFAPVIVDVSNIVLALLDHWSDGLQGVFNWTARVIDIGVQMGAAIVGGVVDIIDGIAQWAQETGAAINAMSFGMAGVWNTTSTLGGMLENALHSLALSGAAAFDVLKSGAGGVAWALGKLVEGFGNILHVMANVADLGGMTAWATALDKIGGIADSTGEKLASWGKKTWNSFGDSANIVNRIFANIDAHLADVRAGINSLGSIQQLKLAGAFDANSKESYSTYANFNATGRDLTDQNGKQLKAIQDGNKLLGMILDAVNKSDGGSVKFGVI